MKTRDLIVEVRKTKTQTRTQTKVQDDPFLRAFGPKVAGVGDQPPAVAPQHQRTRQQVPQLRQAGAVRTQQRLANVTLPAGAEEKLAAIHALDLDDEMPDEEVEQYADVGYEERPRPPGTALATINTALMKAGEVSPEWHQVRHLPGYIQRPIRAMGRQVFGQITSTPIENIQVLADLGSAGEPNTARELNAVAGWLRSHGERDTDGEINFQRAIPDYQAKFFIYRAQGTTFMLVKDFAGQYIYSWPSADEEHSERGQQRIVPQLPRR